MSTSERRGCLAVLLDLLGFGPGRTPNGPDELPYRRRDDFLSAAELSFYRALLLALGGQLSVCPKVRVADVVFVANGPRRQSFTNKIDRKHVDFLVCDPATLRPLCAVELDDSSHQRAARRERDDLLNAVFQAAGMPLVRVTTQAAYQPADLRALVHAAITGGPAATHRAQATEGRVPVCPKCGVPMIARVGRQGQFAGKTFYGCSNYPRCKEIIPA